MGDKELREIWLCEGCGEIEIQPSPPDKCRLCDHRYFESLCDLVEEADESMLH